MSIEDQKSLYCDTDRGLFEDLRKRKKKTIYIGTTKAIMQSWPGLVAEKSKSFDN